MCVCVCERERETERLRSIHGNAPRITLCRSQWPRELRHGSTVVRLPGLRVRIPPGAWMSVSWVCYVLPGTGFCARLTPVQKNPTECGVSECDHEASPIRRPWPTRGCRAMGGGTIPTPCCRRFSIDLYQWNKQNICRNVRGPPIHAKAEGTLHSAASPYSVVTSWLR